VGLNLNIGTMLCNDFKSRINSFRDPRYKRMDAEGYRLFKTEHNSAKIYDKKNEIRKRINKMKDKQGAQHFESRNPDNILRVEFKSHGGANAVGLFLKVWKVGDMVDRYKQVELAWLRHATSFGFNSTEVLPFAAVKKSSKEATDYLKLCGLRYLGDEGLEAILSQLPVEARRDARRSIRQLREQMPDTINIRRTFRQIAVKQFYNHHVKSRQQYDSEMGTAKSLTLLYA
jgi:hypothetical protein